MNSENQTYTVDSAYEFTRKKMHMPLFDSANRVEHYELMLIEDGALKHWINDQEQMLNAGDLLFFRHQDKHQYQITSRSTASILNVSFGRITADHLVARYKNDLAGNFFWHQNDMPVIFKLSDPQKERAVNAMLGLESSKRSLARLEHFLLSIMMHVLDASSLAQARAPQWLLNAALAVRKPEVFRQGAQGMFSAAARTQAHVCRECRKHFGLSPTQYVNRIRIQHAAMLLAQPETPIATIAEDCGFTNLSYFHRLFREQYGCTPNHYRDRHRKE